MSALRPVPVNMWSSRSEHCEVPASQVTLVCFPPHAVLAPHTHDRPTLAIILDGSFDLRLGGPARRKRTLECPVGTILTQPAAERHANYIAASGARGVVLQPNTASDWLPSACAAMLDRVNHFRDGPIETAARHLAHEFMAPDALTPITIESLVLEILADAAGLERETGFRQGDLPRWLILATDLVHSRFRENLRIADIARAADIHPTHLAAVFRRVHRLPLGNYIRLLRVEWATGQLLATDAPISGIAASAGFADQAHLTRWFRRVTGTTPAAYRRERRGSAARRSAWD